MSTPSLLCAGLELAFNRYLALEPEVLADCAKLSGRCIALHADGPGWDFFLCPHAGGVQVLDAWPGKPDVRISAPPTLLLKRLVRREGDDSILSGVTVEGDADLLLRFGRLLERVGFEPEEWVAKVVGDGAAHRVTETLKSLLGWGRSTAGTLALDTAEYLREETRDLPHRDDVEQWIAGVDATRQQSEALESRLARLERVPLPVSVPSRGESQGEGP